MDLLLSAALFDGPDPLHSAHKLGGPPAAAGSLSPDDRVRYVAPFLATAEQWKVDAVILHDGLPRIDTPVHLTFMRSPDYMTNCERRFILYRDYLRLQRSVERVWVVDVNDTAFAIHPFQWTGWAHKGLHIGQLFQTYAYEWFEKILATVPQCYVSLIAKEYRNTLALSCGTFGGPKHVVINVLNDMIWHFSEISEYHKKHPSIPPMPVDMVAIAAAALARDDLNTFFMDAKTAINGVPSPVIHDRAAAIELIRRMSNLLYIRE